MSSTNTSTSAFTRYSNQSKLRRGGRLGAILDGLLTRFDSWRAEHLGDYSRIGSKNSIVCV
ncbi:hypothetical protein BJV78DRAFT_1257578, partial [Lactifluus subvellereus]